MMMRPVHITSILSVSALAVLLILVSCGDVRAQIPLATQHFDEGTARLSDGEFRDAIQAFDRAEQLGLASGALYYNRGVAHYRLEELGQAVKYFRRAERLLPDDPQVLHSLQIVSGRIVDRFSELPTPIWKRTQRSMLAMLPVNTLYAIGLVAYLLFVGLVIARIRRSGGSVWFRRLRSWLAACAAAFLITGLSSSIWPPYRTQAVIVVVEESMQEQPDSASVVTQTIHEGLVVSTLARGDGWVLIQLPNGARGWINARSVSEI